MRLGNVGKVPEILLEIGSQYTISEDTILNENSLARQWFLGIYTLVSMASDASLAHPTFSSSPSGHIESQRDPDEIN